MERKNLLGLLILADLVILAIITMVFVFPGPAITGYISAEGGHVTTVEISPTLSIWQGYYGRLMDVSDSDTISFSGMKTDVEYRDLDLLRCYGSEIYASTLERLDFERLKPAGHEILDYLDIQKEALSAYNVFDEISPFEVGGSDYYLNSVRLNSETKEYYTGLLEQEGTPVFVSNIIKGEGFDGRDVDYQMILPSPYFEVTDYNLFLDPSDDCNALSVLIDKTIQVEEGDVVDLNASYIDKRKDTHNVTYKVTYSGPVDEDGRWETGYFDSGVYLVRIKICDNLGLCDEETVSIVVRDLPYCGDYYCDYSEDCHSCPGDCGACESGNRTFSYSVEDKLEKSISLALLALEKEPIPEGIVDKGTKKRQLKRTLGDLKELNQEKVDYETGKTANFSEEKYYMEIDALRERFRRESEGIPLHTEVIEDKKAEIKYVNIRGDTDVSEEKDILEKKTFEDYQNGDDSLKYSGRLKTYNVSYVNGSRGIITILSLDIEAKRNISYLDLFITTGAEAILASGRGIIEDGYAALKGLRLDNATTTGMNIAYEGSVGDVKIVGRMDEYKKGIEPFIEYPLADPEIPSYAIVAVVLLILILLGLVAIRINESEIFSGS